MLKDLILYYKILMLICIFLVCIYSVRVKCERTRSGVKRYKAVKALYRNHIKDLDVSLWDMKRGAWRQPYPLMLTAVGLWNFYLMAA